MIARTGGPTRLYAPIKGRAHLNVSLDELRKELLADFRAEQKRPRLASQKIHKPSGILHVVAPVDLHMGKLAWHPETGEDYDLKIAESRLHFAIETLLTRASSFKVTQHLFVVGNDLLQVDNLLSATTAGTLQDTDSRYRKLFRHAVSAMSWAAERMADIAPVRILAIPGNHDLLATFHIGEVLAARFANHPRVTVDADISPRLYYRHGQTLMGFTHGNEEKHADLPLIMATERQDDWAHTRFHEWMVGHWHHKRETRYTAGNTMNGVSVRILPSLSGTDAWHAKRGYLSPHKRSESFLYDIDEGLLASFIATVSEAA